MRGAILFAVRFHAGIRDGTITRTVRRWKRARVVAGRRYRTPAGWLEVTSIEPVDSPTEEDARLSGFDSVAALLDATDRHEGDLYRIEFRYLGEPPPRRAPADLDARLARLPWAGTVLALIAEHPARRAPDLAEMLGQETAPFKASVRRLKELGLTESLPVGYRLTPAGAATLAHLSGDPSSP